MQNQIQSSSSPAGGRTMSMFDTATLCLACKERERQRPDYQDALEAEQAAIRRGDCNFPGIGWQGGKP